MASDILHIKDSYYFEVPRALWKSNRGSAKEFADGVGGWVVRNDDDYQDWEADKIIARLKEILGDEKGLSDAKTAWKDWQHAGHARAGRPFDQYVDDRLNEARAKAETWASGEARKAAKEGKPAAKAADPLQAYLAYQPDSQLEWMYRLKTDANKQLAWNELRRTYDSRSALDEYLATPKANWSAEKVKEYNKDLSGKIFIPQPFGELRNAYEVQSGFGISRYMVVEIAVAMVLVLAFRWLAGHISSGKPPRGKVWNLLESFVVFIRSNIVVPAMGDHDADRFLPFLWTLFMFILGCNLAGMIPWVGAPTSVLATTGTLALMVLVIGMVAGIRTFGVMGYLKNLSPELGLPIYLAIFVVPLVWAIEALSLFIKHGVLAVRLLANMVAGHLVLLGFMGIAFGLHALTMSTGMWSFAAVISIVASTLLSFLELFVAFLQAYIFTFLAAMFIGNAIHHH